MTLVIDAGMKSQKVLKAKLVRRDSELDLALLKADGDAPFKRSTSVAARRRRSCRT